MSIQDTISNDADISSTEVKQRAKEESLHEKTRAAKIKNDIEEQDKEERKTYARTITRIILFWLIFVIVVVIGTGIELLHFSDKVLITLLTTTTANVIGLFIIVANYLFKSKPIRK